MRKCLCIVFAGIILLAGCGGSKAVVVTSPVEADGGLNGVSGNVFNVNMVVNSFELLKETVFDPKTNEGKSRHTVY